MNKKILIIGDLFLDIYSNFDSLRNSPEVNAPVLINKKKSYYIGGAGNLAANLKSFNEEVILISFFNNNKIGQIIKRILKKKKIQTFFLKKKKFYNITKERIISNNAQLARIDNEKKTFHTNQTLKIIRNYLKKNIHFFKSIIVSDYDKGLINGNVMKIISLYSKKNNIPVFVDPKKSNPKIYAGVNFITPNIKEFKNFYPYLNYTKKIKKIFKVAAINYLVVTNGSKGSFFINKKLKKINFKGFKITKRDVSGAGDTFLASLVYSFLKTKNIELSMNFANKMASEVVKIKNISVPSKKSFLAQRIKFIKDNKKNKINIWKKKKYKIGVANGCFDLYHEGHKYFLSECKKYCDKLVILLNTDISVKINKGKGRPVDKLDVRYKNIINTIDVDECIPFSEITPIKKLKKILPNIIFKGSDYTSKNVIGYSLLKKNKGKIKIINRYKKYSTTNIINNL
jgi:D-beta-D-heptose 7-phosphate kinase/D-beta-D-heptose 1-phosphate adenosyltransferase